jgi:hypothetical protein
MTSSPRWILRAGSVALGLIAALLLSTCATIPNVPADGIWDDIGEPSEGLVAVRMGSLWGYADTSGGPLIVPQFAEACPFSEGKAAVRLTSRWGFINREGKYVVTPSYLDAGPFSDDRAAVKTATGWGYIDEAGKMLIPAGYDNAGTFSEGLAPVRLSQRWGYINRDGHAALSMQFKKAGGFSEGKAPVAVFSDDNEWGYIDHDGNFAIKPAFDGARSFTVDRKAAVLLDGRWGYIDESGAFAVNPRFDGAGDFSGGAAPVNDKGRWGIIDEEGSFTEGPRWSLLGSFHDGLARAEEENGRVALIDTSGVPGEIAADISRARATGKGAKGAAVLRIEVRDYFSGAAVPDYTIARALGEYGEYVFPDPARSGPDGVILLSLDEERYNRTKALFGEKPGWYTTPLDISDRKQSYIIKTLSTGSELPRIDEVLLSRDGAKQPVNILFQQEVFERGKSETARLSFKVHGARFPVRKYFLQQGNKRVESDSPDFDVEAGTTFSVDDPIHAGIVIDFQDMAVAMPTFLTVRLPKELEKPITIMPSSPEMKIPDSIKFLGGQSGSLKIPGYSFGYTYEGDTVTIFVGADPLIYRNGNRGREKAFEDWMKGMCKRGNYAKEVWGYWRGHNPKPGTMGSGTMQASFGGLGYVKMAVDKKGRLDVIDGQLIVFGEFGCEFNGQFMAAFIPVYASFGVGGKISVLFQLDKKEPKEMDEFFRNVTLSITPYVDFEGGLGVKGIASVGLGVHADMPLEFQPKAGKSAGQIIVSILLRIRALLFFNWEYKLAKGQWQLWKNGASPGDGGSPPGEPPQAVPTTTEIAGEMTLENRSYLAAGSQWLGGAAPPEITGDKPPVVFQPLRTNILPGSEPFLIQALGREFLFWVDDAGSARSGADRTALLFSIRQADGSWAAPKPVRDTGRADFDFAVVEHRGVLYVAWQNATKVFNREKLDLREAASNSQILVAAWDATSGGFGEPKHIDGREGTYVGRPRLASDGNVMALSYVFNNAGDYFLGEGSTNVYLTRMIGDSWANELLNWYSANKRLIGYDLFVSGGTPYVVANEDEDRKLETVDDRSIVMVNTEWKQIGDDIHKRIEHRDPITGRNGRCGNPRVAHWKGNDALFYFAAESDTGKGNYFYFEDIFGGVLGHRGSPHEVFPSDTLVNEDFSVVVGPRDKLGLLFIEENKEKESMLRSTPAFIIWDQKRGHWSLPVRMWSDAQQTDKRAEAAKGVWTAEDRIDITYRSLPASAEGGVNDPVPTDLMLASTIPTVDLVVTPQSILRYNEPEVGGCLLPFEVEVVNQGLAAAHGIMSDLVTPGLDSLGYGKAYKEVELRPGDRVVIPMEYRLPMDTEQPITAKVSVRTLQDPELYTVNNTAPITFADPDIGFGQIDMIRKGFQRQFLVQLLNRSPVRVRDVELILIDTSDGREIRKIPLGTILANKSATADLVIDLASLPWGEDPRKILRFELRSSDVLKGDIRGESYVVFNPYSYPAFSLAVFDAHVTGGSYVWVSAAASNNHPVRREGTLVIDIMNQNDERETGTTAPVKVDQGGTQIVTHLFHVNGDARHYKVRVSMTGVSKTQPGSPDTGGLMAVGGDPVPVEADVAAGGR